MIRTLDIRRGERWTSGRLPLHMAAATIGHCRPARPRRRIRFWRIMAWVAVLPNIAAIAMIAAITLLRWGL
jgi:hypothetical protein